MNKPYTRRIHLILILTLAFLIAVGFAVSAADTLQDWIAAPLAPISGGYGEGVIGTGNGVFLVRCLYATSEPQVYVYTQTGSWTVLGASGLEPGVFRNGTALAWDSQDHIYALAGARYTGDPQRTVFLRYSISDNTWEHIKSTRWAQGAGDAITWSGYDNKIYAIIGSRLHNNGNSGFASYDPETNTWTPLAFDWENTDDGAALAWAGGDSLYALRGEYLETLPTKEFAEYHISTGKWNTLNPLPDLAGVGDGGSLIWTADCSGSIFALSGGAADESLGSGFFCYSIGDGTWKRLGDIPCQIGYYVGNRLAYTVDGLYYWQGSPKTAGCGGAGFYKTEIADTTSRAIPSTGEGSALVINEVELNPRGSDSGAEWIEVYNATSEPIDLSGWSISYTNYGGGIEYLPPTIVFPHRYFVYTYMKQHLNNTNGWEIQLRDPGKNLIDSTPVGLRDSENDLQTWQRVPNGVDTDSLSDWKFMGESPGEEN